MQNNIKPQVKSFPRHALGTHHPEHVEESYLLSIILTHARLTLSFLSSMVIILPVAEVC